MPDFRKDYAEKLAAYNAKGVWNKATYDELKELEERIKLLPPEPDPEPELALEEPEAKPKKGR